MVWNAAATGRAGDAGGGQGLDRRAALALLGLGALGCRGGHDAASPVDAGAASLTLPAPAPRDGQWQRGASLGLFVSRTDAEYRRGIYETFLAEMADAGVTDVQLIVRWTARTVNDPHLVPEAPGDDDQLRAAIAAARARRMRVFLMPLVHIRERRAADWRGALAPTDWAQWWQSYAAFIEHYARLAAASEVSLLAVGSELVSAEAQVDRWRDLIARVRRLYSGRLTYSANWDHFEPVGFFDRL
ncbi:MAG: hypothetical protein KC620_06315, partial [Myxococcales bacterium]|nr:hypothetical protein [Myxococcales bacterium]